MGDGQVGAAVSSCHSPRVRAIGASAQPDRRGGRHRTNLSGADRQREAERRAGTRRALDRDRPAVSLDEPAGDRQPEAGAARVGRLREPVEDVGQERRVDARRRCRGPSSSTRSGRRSTRAADRDAAAAAACGGARSRRGSRATSRIRTGSTSRSGRSSVDVDRERDAGRRRRPRSNERDDLADEHVEVGRLAVERRACPASDRAIVRRSSIEPVRGRASPRGSRRGASASAG